MSEVMDGAAPSRRFDSIARSQGRRLHDADRLRAVAAAGRLSDRHRCAQRPDPADALSAAAGADGLRRPRTARLLPVRFRLGSNGARRGRLSPRLPTRFDWWAIAGTWFVPFAIGFVIVYPMIVLAVNGRDGAVTWIDNFGIQILIYVMLGWGLNIVVGLAGLLDLGYVAFYAVGAYSYALLAKTFGLVVLDPVAARRLSRPRSGALLLGFPVLRLRGDYLAIVTLAFGEIIRMVLINWVALTNGYAGISGIPRPTFFGIPFNADDDGFAATIRPRILSDLSHVFLYYLILALALLTAFVTVRCDGCRSGAPGKLCARTRSPAARSASTPPTPSSPRSPSARCSRALPARSSPRGKVLFRRNRSPSWNRQRSSRSSCSAAWAARSASPSPPSS